MELKPDEQEHKVYLGHKAFLGSFAIFVHYVAHHTELLLFGLGAYVGEKTRLVRKNFAGHFLKPVRIDY